MSSSDVIKIPVTEKLSDDQLTLSLHMPHFLGVEKKCFDPSTYSEDEAKSKFPGATAIVRWRYVKDENGNIKKESNSKIVKYKDGTYQILIGGDIYILDSFDISGRYE